MNRFLTSNEATFRLLRTIVQGVIGVILANADIIVGAYVINDVFRPLIVALVMAILSPIMAELGKKKEEADDGEDI